MKTKFFCYALLAVSALALKVKAEPSVFDFGLGVDKSKALPFAGVTFRIGFRKVLGDSKIHCIDSPLTGGHDWLWSVQFKGDLTAVQIAEEKDWLAPALDLEIVPVALTRVNCYEKEPSEGPHFQFQGFPIRVGRALGEGIRSKLSVAIVGAEWYFGTGAKDQFTKALADPAVRLMTRLVTQFFGLAWADFDQTNGDQEFKGLHLIRGALETALRTRFKTRCDATWAAHAGIDISAGTTGILRQYELGSRLALGCLEKKRNARLVNARSIKRNGLFFEARQRSWEDEEQQSGSDFRVLTGYEARF